MVEETPARNSNEEKLLQQQYLRALSSFEGIILSQIEIKNKLGNRLNYSIGTGLLILSAIALSILVLLLTLSAQITRISQVVASMNTHFTAVADKMDRIRDDMIEMEQRVALLEQIDHDTAVIDEQMVAIGKDMDRVQVTVRGIGAALAGVRGQVGTIALTIDRMNGEVQAISAEMHHMAQPARSFNKMFPFP